MIFLSELLRATIVDVHQHTVGRVRDLVARVQDPYPRVVGLVVHGGRGAPVIIPWSAVRQYTEREISLRMDTQALPTYRAADDELWLSRDVLDKQLVDTDGQRVVRVNDLQLSSVGASLLVVGVDIGGRGLLRRLGLEEMGKRLARAVGRDWAQKFIAWDAVDPVRGDARSMQLRISHRKLARLHPADIADIVEQLSNDDRQAIFASLDDETAADTLEETDEEVQAQIFQRLPVERAADILEAMAPDEAADLLAELPDDRRAELIARMESEEAEDVEELLGYGEDTAGGLMTTEFVAVPQHLTTAQTIDRLRQLEPDAESIYYVYVVDAEERLLGVLSLRDLIVAAPEKRIGDLMIRKIISVPLDARPDDVAATLAKYNLLAVPVVDDLDRIQGIVTVDDALEEMLPAHLKRRARARAHA